MKISKYKILLAFLDYFFLNLSFAFAMRLRFKPQIDIVNLKEGFVIKEILIFAAISIIIIYLFEKNQLYRYHVISNRKLHFSKLFRSLMVDALIVVLISAYIFKLGSRFESRLFIVYFLLASLLIFLIYRVWLFKFLFLWIQKKGYYSRKLIIYGAGKTGQQVKKLIETGKRWSFIGFIDDNKQPDDNKQILGNFDHLIQLSKKGLVNSVIIAIANPDQKKLQDLIDALKLYELRIFLVSEKYEVIYRTQQIEIFDELPLIEVNYNSQSFNIVFIKRAVDIISSIFLMLFLSPVFLIVSIIIKLTSKGPVIFTQKRIGINGNPFKFYKFRSMYIDNKSDKHEKFIKNFIAGTVTDETKKITNDSRITPIGKYIRTTSIDELPQLFNVLRGEMSLVGPRPCLPYEYKEYKDWHKARFLIKPGCTGVWQVSGRSQVSFDEMIIMDYYYIHNMTPWMDLKLILKTIPVILFGKGGF